MDDGVLRRLRDAITQVLSPEVKGGAFRDALTKVVNLDADNLQDSIALGGRVWNTSNIQLVKDEPFAFFKGNDIVINGTGELQIIDILGRCTATLKVHDSQSVQRSLFPVPGVYILRLCGDKVRTQKIVIQTSTK